ncbi:MAG TPA: UDP-N-acetylglucosamine 1-carboxyvinyltransferase [Candidatus Egerieimonas intestinavium]|uniref:UDP-N-acetylglucosamine 1-carboxyvinyltransferase n=1 Tax=Candidatus Egerieimonas intestinavium TaxID=2840777 RepID=A0A9D1EL89_9FIRM|nr:UDP-N-acetylglucosamine 1-carboxyvinyltransferase [Candidatus Egerieimonas intestinavium]
MEKIRIEGGIPLNGEVRIQGSKNTALPVMAAALLHEGTCVLENCPRIADVFCMEKILQALGAVTCWEGHRLILDCSHLTGIRVPAGFAGQMRSSIMLLGSMLGRMGGLKIAYPGGCTIGRRPINWHLQVMKEMGASVTEDQEGLYASCGRLEGTALRLPFPSVGATENALLAAVRARGTTVISGCAREPEILHLCDFLAELGVPLWGAGTGCIRVEGGARLRDAVFSIPPDRIVAGTYLYAGAATRGRVDLQEAPVEEMGAILAAYEKMGGQYSISSGTLRTNSAFLCRPIPWVRTESYPGFPTDMQSALLTVLCTVPGRSVICETIFEDRYKVVPELWKMGADISLTGRRACVRGGPRLAGTGVTARELRGGAALVLAGLAAEGVTQLEGWQFVKRGYEDLLENLQALGGRIFKEHG